MRAVSERAVDQVKTIVEHTTIVPKKLNPDVSVGLGAEWDVVGGRAAGGDAGGPTTCFWMNLARQLLAA